MPPLTAAPRRSGRCRGRSSGPPGSSRYASARTSGLGSLTRTCRVAASGIGHSTSSTRSRRPESYRPCAPSQQRKSTTSSSNWEGTFASFQPPSKDVQGKRRGSIASAGGQQIASRRGGGPMTSTTTGTSTIEEHEAEQIERANASERATVVVVHARCVLAPVVLVHGLWVLASSWDRWATVFDEAGYSTLSPGWPDDPETVPEAKA